MNSLILADAGPGPLLIPIGASMIVAGVFLALSLVSAGLWYARRAEPERSRPWGRRSLIWAGVASLIAAPFVAVFLGLFVLESIGSETGLIVMIVLGVWLILKGRRMPR